MPSASPWPISRDSTRMTSRIFTSPTASARVISVADCEPEFPPELMISGTKNISAVTDSSTPW